MRAATAAARVRSTAYPRACREALFHSDEFESALDAFVEGLAVAGARVKPNIEKWAAAARERIADRPVDMAALKPFSAAANAKDKGHKPAPPALRVPPVPRPALAAAPPAPPADFESDDDEAIIAATVKAAKAMRAPTAPAGAKAADAMARPGPAATAGDLLGVPFTAGVPLEGASKYR